MPTKVPLSARKKRYKAAAPQHELEREWETVVSQIGNFCRDLQCSIGVSLFHIILSKVFHVIERAFTVFPFAWL